ncbi:hypothetical protein QT979_13470 [Microcoleus sp. w2-18bC1]|uniref:hypothetical protein n=1 Tax=unclassified Microcoleus TaxID=2642155 RepID=UPI002FD26D7E
MAIVFMSKTAKKRSLLIDALRILAWEEYKSTNKEALKNLQYGGYAVFDKEWQVDEIHGKGYEDLLAFAKSLEFSEAELLSIRSKYYSKKANTASTTPTKKDTSNGNIPENVSAYETIPEEYDIDDVF